MSYFPEHFQIRTTMRKHRKLTETKKTTDSVTVAANAKTAVVIRVMDIPLAWYTVESPC